MSINRPGELEGPLPNRVYTSVLDYNLAKLLYEDD